MESSKENNPSYSILNYPPFFDIKNKQLSSSNYFKKKKL